MKPERGFNAPKGPSEVSQACIDLIEKFEGFKASPYKDPIGLVSIGYGFRSYADGTPVRMSDPPISIAKAQEICRHKANQILKEILKCTAVPLTQGCADALTSFCYNIGVGKYRRSTLLKKLNQGDYQGAAAEFPKWDRAGGKTISGLLTRRLAEQALFLQQSVSVSGSNPDLGATNARNVDGNCRPLPNPICHNPSHSGNEPA